jgi:uncharacterized tellurite resistance protein B-like protein
MKLNQLLQEYVNKSYSELLDLAESAMVVVYPYCRQVDKKYNGAFMLSNVLMVCIAADGKISSQEFRFIADLTGMPSETLIELAKSLSDEQSIQLVDKFADALNSEAKAAMTALIVAVLCCDGRVTSEENKFLRKIIA